MGGLLKITVVIIVIFQIYSNQAYWSKKREDEASVYDVTEFFRRRTQYSCFPYLRPWFHDDDYAQERTEFLFMEYHLQGHCSVVKPFHVTGHFEKLTVCESLLLCNTTECVLFPRMATALMYKMSKNCISDIKENVKNDFVILDKNNLEKPNYQNISSDERIFLTATTSVLRNETFFEEMKTLLKFHPNFFVPFYNKHSAMCNENNSRTMLLEGIGDLPSECSDVGICSSKSCMMVPQTAFALATKFRRAQFARSWGLDAPSPCGISYYRRIVKRSVVPIYDDLFEPKTSPAYEQYADKITNVTHGIMSFNLPGM